MLSLSNARVYFVRAQLKYSFGEALPWWRIRRIELATSTTLFVFHATSKSLHRIFMISYEFIVVCVRPDGIVAVLLWFFAPHSRIKVNTNAHHMRMFVCEWHYPFINRRSLLRTLIGINILITLWNGLSFHSPKCAWNSILGQNKPLSRFHKLLGYEFLCWCCCRGVLISAEFAEYT